MFSVVVMFARVSDASQWLSVSEGLAQHCSECHNEGTSEAGVRFDNLGELPLVNQLAILNRAQEQVFFKLMPPQDSGGFSREQRRVLGNHIRSVLNENCASNLDARLSQPAYGNFVDHESLFSGEVREKGFSPARRWLVSPQIFHERVNDVFQLEQQARQRKFYGVTNPIVLPDIY